MSSVTTKRAHPDVRTEVLWTGRSEYRVEKKSSRTGGSLDSLRLKTGGRKGRESRRTCREPDGRGDIDPGPPFTGLRYPSESHNG